MRRRSAALLLVSFCLGLLSARAGEVPVAVAANFAAPVKPIAEAFERATGHRAVIAVGSTGRFYAQVRNGAPFQVLLSADQETPERLEREGFAVAGTRFTYAVGRLVLWSATPGRVDAQGEVLRRGDFERLAIADPRLAPYGAAAVQAMQRLGAWKAMQPKLVQGESIAQAHQFVATGNAPLGFVALSQVALPGGGLKGSGWIVPASLHDPLRQDAVLLHPGRGNPAAAAFLDFLRSEPARAIVRAHGYQF